MPAAHFTNDDFEEKVLKSDKPVMVDFFAEWCGPCKMAEPVIDELSDTYQDKVVIGKIDVDENNETAGKYGVMSIPTVLMFKDGKEVARKVGYGGKQGYEELLKSVI
jgi:thioredoxin 1